MTKRKRLASPVLCAALLISGGFIGLGCEDNSNDANRSAERAGEKLENAADKAGDKARAAGEKIEDGAERAADKTRETVRDAKD